MPVAHQSKKPVLNDWQHLEITSELALQYFNGHRQNIGVRLGDKYGSTDVDLDCPEAVAGAHILLPETGMIFGRQGKPFSHYFYRSDPRVTTQQFKDPLDKKMLIELRGLKKDGSIGLQTVVPPSIHEEGELIRFETGFDGTPANIDADALLASVRRVAAAALFARRWPKQGSRHDAFLALAGTLARSGWSLEDAMTFHRAIYCSLWPTNPDLAASDTEVQSTFARQLQGSETTGIPTLIELLDKKVVDVGLRWLTIDGDQRQPQLKPARHQESPCHGKSIKHVFTPYPPDLVTARPKSFGKVPKPEPAGDIPVKEEQVRTREWKELLIFGRVLLANAITALRFAPEWDGVLGYNLFSVGTVALKRAPWGSPEPGFEWSDHEDKLTANWLQHEGIYVSPEIAGQAVQAVARDHEFHPVRDYLDDLTWDGVNRLDTWLIKYLGVESPELNDGHASYVSAVGSRYLISAVARIYQPGCKADCCLILEGPQGLKKSTALQIMAGEWFTDEIADLGTKDAALQTHGVWLIEIGELDSMSRSEVGRVKAFMSRATDRFRPPYGKRPIKSPRQCVFAGSVNHSAYLRDETGGRRFWPVTCTAIDIEKPHLDRDQLWAEAKQRFEAGDSWWLDSVELNAEAEVEQGERYEDDSWDEVISQWLSSQELISVSVSEILTYCIGKRLDQWVQADKTRVGRSLVSLGWKRRNVGPRGAREWRYFPKTK